MPQATTLLVDDQDPQIQYLCPSIHQVVAGSYYNNTWTTLNSDSCSNGWFQYTFYGTGIYVQTAVASGASYSVKLDGGEFVKQTGNGEYTSPTLSDGKHTITYAATNGGSLPPVFDYITVIPSTSTPLQGSTLAVDDDDPSIHYSGSWSTKPPSPVSFDYSTALYEQTTHWASQAGDSLKFSFQGSSVSVFGIATNIASGGNITTTYTLDGVSITQSLPTGTLDTLPMVKLYHADLQPGSHTLVVNITDIQPTRALGIDFIAYNSTFDSLASVPVNATPGSSSQASPSLNSRAKAGIAIGTLFAVAVLCMAIYSVARGQLRKKFNTRMPSTNTLDSDVDVEKSSNPQHTW